MGGGSFIPRQQNWKWFQNDAAEPTTSLAAENTSPVLADSNIIRLRVTIAETGGKGASGQSTDILYSSDLVSWFSMSASNDWNYANGQATGGNTVTTNKLSDTSNKQKYHESSTVTETWSASTAYEEDWAIQPTIHAKAGTIYYFFIAIAGVEASPNTGKVRPSLTTAITSKGNFFDLFP